MLPPPSPIPTRQAARGPRIDFICSGGVNPPGIEVLPEAKRLVGSAGGRFLQHPLEILPGVGGGTLCHLLGGAGDDDIAAAVAALGAEVDDVVGGLDRSAPMPSQNMKMPVMAMMKQEFRLIRFNAMRNREPQMQRR